MISNKDGLELLANIFIKEGIKDIVISPGSRNAPMMLTFPEYEEFNIYSIIDERSAGFFALGIAQKTRRPVVLNCTSGSALLNYAPAIAEAYYQQIPLIVLSADRPEKLIDQGDGQAIQQQDVYRNFIRKSVHLLEDIHSKKDEKNYQKLVFKSIEAARYPVMGPIHINVPFDEPIYGEKEKSDIRLIDFKPENSTLKLDKDRLNELQQKWNQASKKMIIVGQLIPNQELNQILEELSDHQDVIVLTESTSNLHADIFVSKIDQTLTQINESNEYDFYPDLILSIGGHIVSKKIKAWLRKNENLAHWHISEDRYAHDVFYNIKEHIKSEETQFLKQLINQSSSSKYFQKRWLDAFWKTNQSQKEFLEQIPYSDLMVFHKIEELIPSNSQLHFANSTPVRYSQFFNFGDQVIIDSNRGVSGIDGSVSTALGQSLCFDGQTILITGDLSFFYDNNALWNHYLHPNFKVILINNGGGGIFRFIDGPLNSGKIDLFETPHSRTAKNIALDAGIKYSCCKSESELDAEITTLISSEESYLLEIFTPRSVNDVVLKDYFKFLRSSE